MRKLWIAILVVTVLVVGSFLYWILHLRRGLASDGPTNTATELAEGVVKKLDGVITTGTRSQRAAASAGSMNRVIDFWGQILDQDGQPLAGAEVVGIVMQWQLVPPVSVAGQPQTNHVVSDVAFRHST